MLKELTKQFLKEEDGAGLLEYLILAALVGIIAIMVIKPLRNWVASAFAKIIENINGVLTEDTDEIDNPLAP